MYEALEHYKVYKQKQNELKQAKVLFEECGFQRKEKAKQEKDLQNKIAQEFELFNECGFQYKKKAHQEMDKFLNKLIKKNGTTKY